MPDITDYEWRPMETAPKDGTRVWLKIRHRNWQYVHSEEDRSRWQEVVGAKWIEHNGGGWTYHGLYGDPVGWRPQG